MTHRISWPRSLPFLAVSVMLAPLSTAQAPPPSAPPTISLPAPLARVLTDYEAAWRNEDAVSLATLFTEDGFVLASGSPPVQGRLQIQKHYAHAGGPLVLRALAFAVEGTVGYIIGGYGQQEGQPDSGKFTLTLRKGADGRWLIASDMDNRNSRP
jgi:ketosteroid isomerase-like protein